MRRNWPALVGMLLGTAMLDLEASMAEGKSTDLIELVRTIARSGPFTRAKVERILGVKLDLVNQTPYFAFLAGAGPDLADGTTIKSIDLRLPQGSSDHQGFIVLELAGRCMTFPELERALGKLQLTDAPRGRSADESIGYTAKIPDATIRVAFKERDPRCANVISIEPGK